MSLVKDKDDMNFVGNRTTPNTVLGTRLCDSLGPRSMNESIHE